VATQEELVLRFDVAGRRCGIRLPFVHELLPMVALTSVTTEPGLEGLLNLRGHVVPVIDIRAAMHLPAKEPEPADRLIVARVDERLLALRADDVHDVSPCRPAGGEGMGIVQCADELVYLPDLAALSKGRR
jgi:chemotaxis signal transduction protein